MTGDVFVVVHLLRWALVLVLCAALAFCVADIVRAIRR